MEIINYNGDKTIEIDGISITLIFIITEIIIRAYYGDINHM